MINHNAHNLLALKDNKVTIFPSYTLITKQGKVMRFYIGEVADLYQRLEGGVVLTDSVVVEPGGEQQLVDLKTV